MSLKIQDTMSGEKRPFEPLEEGKVKMYVCGVTPYARCHLGHARCYVAFDLVYRYLKFLGYAVTYVRNFTDVDDKIINRANERGMVAMDLAQENIEAFYEDMDALGIARPDVEPRVSTSITEIVEMVQTLVDKGLAYAVDGDVYYAVDAFAEYGKLSKRSFDEMQAGARVDVNEKKRNPMDFALWKAAKPGEPKWPSPWGEGRPGWHIECSAMSCTHLGASFDLHGGGRDLVFPHHENEIAQTEGATGVASVRYWLHNGFVNIDDEKMSKSLGNVFNISDLFQRYEPLVLRYFLISAAHYRNPINFNDALLDQAAGRLAYFYESLRKGRRFVRLFDEDYEGPLPCQDVIDTFEARFREAMDDDFSGVKAMDPLSDAFKALNELASTSKARKKPAAARAAALLLDLLAQADEVLNLFGDDPEAYLLRHRAKAAQRRGLDTAAVAARIAERLQARNKREWAEADAIRDALALQGVVLMDRPDGDTDWMVHDEQEPTAP
ncbi:MAG: cysteine--tRNA ligase [Myxococcales bacterium]|nr:cysteine--tRNA ligase [Myxococcales bacterium]